MGLLRNLANVGERSPLYMGGVITVLRGYNFIKKALPLVGRAFLLR